jgi:hypothetical protein
VFPISYPLIEGGSGANSATYTFGTALGGTVGNEYRLCWAQNPEEFTEYVVEIASDVDLVGPLDTELSCTLGLRCGLTLAGYALGDLYSFIVIQGGDCGSADAAAVDWGPGASVFIGPGDEAAIAMRALRSSGSAPEDVDPDSGVARSLSDGYGYGYGYGSSGSDGHWQSFTDIGVPTEGLPGNFYKVCWAYAATELADYKVEVVDVATLVGPGRSDLACTLGVGLCEITVSGYQLAQTNKLVVLQNGTCGGADAVVATGFPTGDCTPYSGGRALRPSGLHANADAFPSRMLQSGPYNFGSNNIRFGLAILGDSRENN